MMENCMDRIIEQKVKKNEQNTETEKEA